MQNYKSVKEFWSMDHDDESWQQADHLHRRAKLSLITGLLLKYLEAPCDKNTCRKVAQGALKQAKDYGLTLLAPIQERATQAVRMTLPLAT